jgi:hypothetical protein
MKLFVFGLAALVLMASNAIASCLDDERRPGVEIGTMALTGEPWYIKNADGTLWEIPAEYLVFTFGEDRIVWGGDRNVLWADRISSIWNSITSPDRPYLVVRRPDGWMYVAVDIGNPSGCLHWYIRRDGAP